MSAVTWWVRPQRRSELAASSWADYTNYFAVAHPSLPNYLAIASGTTAGSVPTDLGGGNLGVTTVWDQLTADGIPWAVYEETMPSRATCPSRQVSPQEYVLKHNPATPFDSVFSDPATMRACAAPHADGSTPAAGFLVHHPQ